MNIIVTEQSNQSYAPSCARFYATTEDYDGSPDDPIGMGRTPDEARADLLELLEGME